MGEDDVLQVQVLHLFVVQQTGWMQHRRTDYWSLAGHLLQVQQFCT